jgi:hypothetical protein
VRSSVCLLSSCTLLEVPVLSAHETMSSTGRSQKHCATSSYVAWRWAVLRSLGRPTAVTGRSRPFHHVSRTETYISVDLTYLITVEWRLRGEKIMEDWRSWLATSYLPIVIWNTFLIHRVPSPCLLNNVEHNYMYISRGRPPLWSSGSWPQIRRPGFDSRTSRKKKWWVWNGVHSASWVQLRSYLIEK